MISIVIPLYNKDTQIENTLNSILNQTFQDFEIIIVNDGSTDNSVAEVEKFHDSRIRLISQENAGVSAARNRGIEEAHGEFVAFLDADDEWRPDYLETQRKLTQKYPECDIFATNYEFKDIRGKKTPTIINKLPFNGVDGKLSNYFEVASCSHPPVWTSAVMVRKPAITSVGRFPVGIRSGEDLLTWAKLALIYKIAYTSNPHAAYLVDEGHEYGVEPARKQDIGDPVGKELRKLYQANKNVRGLKHYLSHWHKMRASVAMRFGERLETLKECICALKYDPYNFKVIPFIILALTPSDVRKEIIKMKKL